MSRRKEVSLIKTVGKKHSDHRLFKDRDGDLLIWAKEAYARVFKDGEVRAYSKVDAEEDPFPAPVTPVRIVSIEVEEI